MISEDRCLCLGEGERGLLLCCLLWSFSLSLVRVLGESKFTSLIFMKLILSFRLIFKMIEIGLIEDHVSFQVFSFCDR